MKTLLYSNLIRRKVILPMDKSRAKLVEIIVSQRKKFWCVRDVLVETGLIDHQGTYYNPSLLKDIPSKGPISIDKSGVDGSRKSPLGDIFLSRLKDAKVIGPNDEEIGRIYDYELYIEQEPWIVWKILVRPAGLSPTKRRLRIPTKEIEKVSKTEVVLKEGWKE